MTMQTMKLQHSFYQMFDRMGEDVYYDYNVQYDWDDILKNDFTKTNFKIIPIGISSEYDGYFSQYHINKNEWEKVMVAYLLSNKNDMSYEEFLGNLNEKQVEQYDNRS